VAVPYNKRTHSCGELRADHAGQEVILAGWVNSYRDHGGMVFIDLRDREGITQLKFNPQTDPEAHKIARGLRSEDVIAVRGEVALRGENVNPKLATGQIEVSVREVDVLNKSETPPFEVADKLDVNEELRLKYRFIDLRRPVMQRIFRLRHRVAKAIRDYFDREGFIEIETPFLTKSTPEGARDYLVPSRLQPGCFYALPQSPQLFKQLFMIAGFDKYAQIVRCFRDEDIRADRAHEFTQVDLEMAFVQPEDVMAAVEGCAAVVFKEALDYDLPLPLPRISYHEAMSRFGTDRPDTRFGLELHDVTDIVRQTDFGVFRNAIDAGGIVKCLVASGGEKLTRRITDGLTGEIRGMGGGGLPLTKVAPNPDRIEFVTGSAKFLQPFAAQICQTTGAKPGDTIFFMPGPPAEVNKYLAYLRGRLAEILDLIPPGRWDALWVVDFPLLEWSEEDQRWYSMHHPFTAPFDEDVDKLETDPGSVRAKAYDLVINGVEMAGGSIRIHRLDLQQRIFRLLGISEQEAHAKFEHLLNALRFGAPPHGGIAFGLDRWIMMLTGAQSLRDVMAFPKTQRAVCPLTGAPSEVSPEQLHELGLELSAQVRAKQRAQARP